MHARVAIVALLLAGCTPSHPVPRRPTLTVTYRGVPFTVDREDPVYSPRQVETIEGLALAAPAPAECATYADLCAFHASVVVPGSGASSGGYGEITEAGQFTQVSWQVPTRPRHRVLVYRRPAPGAPYRLVDDFLHESAYPPLLTFRVEKGAVVCRDPRTGRTVRTWPLPAPGASEGPRGDSRDDG